MRAEINIALAEDPLQQFHPDSPQLFGTMRTNRLNIFSTFQIRHYLTPVLTYRTANKPSYRI